MVRSFMSSRRCLCLWHVPSLTLSNSCQGRMHAADADVGAHDRLGNNAMHLLHAKAHGNVIVDREGILQELMDMQLN